MLLYWDQETLKRFFEPLYIPTFFPTALNNSSWVQYAPIINLCPSITNATIQEWINILLASWEAILHCHPCHVGFVSPPSWIWLETCDDIVPQPTPSMKIVLSSETPREYELQAVIYRNENHFTCHFLHKNTWWSHDGVTQNGCCFSFCSADDVINTSLISMDKFNAHLCV